MLTRIDRIQLAVPDRRAAQRSWVQLLGAEVEGEDRVACLGASRGLYRVGRGRVELLEPDGAGPVADAVAKRGPHLFAAGAATRDLDGLVAHLVERGMSPTVERGQAFLDPAAVGEVGYRAVLSPDEELDPVGSIDFFYEVTLLVADAEAAVGRCAALFGLEPDAFVPIESPRYGYRGVLTLFDRDRLDRFEVITPTDSSKTMGRYFARFGESFYMAFAESHSLAAIEDRALELGAGFTADPPAAKRDGPAETIFLHPSSLSGMMLGVSRPSLAWQWSGHPERVESRS